MEARVLVVDDEPQLRDVIAQILASQGYRVTTATHGAQGLECLRRERRDLIVLDLMMPVLGVRACLAKPFNVDELIRCAERLLRHRPPATGRHAGRQRSGNRSSGSCTSSLAGADLAMCWSRAASRHFS